MDFFDSAKILELLEKGIGFLVVKGAMGLETNQQRISSFYCTYKFNS
jgi:uncharacterized phage-like protein YoqJ